MRCSPTRAGGIDTAVFAVEVCTEVTEFGPLRVNEMGEGEDRSDTGFDARARGALTSRDSSGTAFG